MININKLTSFLLEILDDDTRIPDEKVLAYLNELLCTSEKSILEVFETLYGMDEKNIQEYMDYLSEYMLQDVIKIGVIQDTLVSLPRVYVSNSFM